MAQGVRVVSSHQFRRRSDHCIVYHQSDLCLLIVLGFLSHNIKPSTRENEHPFFKIYFAFPVVDVLYTRVKVCDRQLYDVTDGR